MLDAGGSLVVWTAIVLPVTYLLYTFFQFIMDVRRRAKHIHKFPGIPPHPIFGHLAEFPGPGAIGVQRFDQFPEFYPIMAKTFFTPLIPAISTHHPKSAKEILRTSEPKPWSFGAYRLIFPWLGDGLLLSKGNKWARNRRLLTPAFHFDILKPYMEINNKCADILLDKLNEYSKKNESVEIFNQISLFALDVILRCAFSYDNDCQTKGSNHPYVQAVLQLAEAAVYRLLRPWFYPDFIFFNFTPKGRRFIKNCNYVHSVSEEIIRTRRQTLSDQAPDTKRGRYLDFLDILITAKDSDGKGLTDREIRDEADTFLFEGHDTTSSGISWALHDLASHPEHQQKCREEIDLVLAGRDSDNITWDDLPKLKYLTLCLKESLRMHSPVPFIERQTTKDMNIDGYFVPKGTIVDINIYVLHHNPTVWKNPMNYDPLRFLPENMEKMDSFAFVPFSAGPRNCIGQSFAMHEMKTILARVLRKFTLSLDPEKTTDHCITVVMKTERGMYLKVKARD